MTGTKIISVSLLPFLVKILIIKENQQVTKNRKFISYLVGTSETTRVSSIVRQLSEGIIPSQRNHIGTKSC